VTVGQTIFKQRTRKVRRLGDGKVLAGFAGGAADGIALFEKFEGKLKEHGGQLTRAAGWLAQGRGARRGLGRLGARSVAGGPGRTFVIWGGGDVIEPDEGVCAIGSGGGYALAAARALAAHTKLGAREIAQAALEIAADICVYTNANLTFEELG